MTYTNPVILCDYSDPDVIRVGNTFYMTASSFNFMPGLPILTSGDLVHWTLVNYAARSIPLPAYDTVQNAKGLWAPAIRWHEGRFYIFVASPDDGIFVTETDDPTGEWSPLRLIWKGRGFEDPCPLWDDDGRVWLVHAYVKSRIGFNSKLGLLEIDPRTLDAVGDDRVIFDGTATQPTIEGPKFYKRGGLYYIFAPAGGVTDGWQTVLRSTRVDGGWEERIVLAQGLATVNGPHQGGLVDTPAGESWFMHFQERGIFGRIVHLQPVVWKDGWPLMGTATETGAACGEPVSRWRMPAIGGESAGNVQPPADGGRRGEADTHGATCAFGILPPAPAHSGAGAHSAMPAPGAHTATDERLHWQWSANPRADFARIGADGSIALAVLDTAPADAGIPLLWHSANVLTQKVRSERFSFSAVFDAHTLPADARTGIVFLGDDYASLAVERTQDGGYALVYLASESAGGDEERTERVKARLPLPGAESARRVTLSLVFAGQTERTGEVRFRAEYADGADGAESAVWEPETAPYVTKNAHWVGGRFGLYAVAAKQAATGAGAAEVTVSGITYASDAAVREER